MGGILKKITVLITGIGSAGLGEQIIKSLRLSDLNLYLIGTDLNEVCFNKDNVDEFLVIPSANNPQYGDYILDLVSRFDIDIIFPGSEAELRYFSLNIHKFNNVIIPINDPSLIEMCLNKHKTYTEILKFGIDVPKFNKNWFRKWLQ